MRLEVDKEFVEKTMNGISEEDRKLSLLPEGQLFFHDTGSYYKAFNGADCIGCAAIFNHKDGTKEGAVYLFPEYRGKRLGAKLIDTINGVMMDKGATKIVGSVSKKNTRVKKILKSLSRRGHDFVQMEVI